MVDIAKQSAKPGLINLIMDYPVEAGLVTLDIITAGLFFGRLAFGLNADPDDKTIKFFFSNAFPHFFLGIAPYLTAAYFVYKKTAKDAYENLTKLPTHTKAMIYGLIATTPVFVREVYQFMNGAKDSLIDSITTGYGIMAGIPLMLVLGNYIKNRYSSKP